MIVGGGIPLPVHYAFVEEDEALYLDLTYPAERGSPEEDIEEHVKLLTTPPTYGSIRS
jgi:hypothetical protein